MSGWNRFPTLTAKAPSKRLIEELDFYAVRAASLEVFFCYQDGRARVGKALPLSPSARFDQLLEAAKLAFGEAYLPGVAITQMHLTASELPARDA